MDIAQLFNNYAKPANYNTSNSTSSGSGNNPAQTSSVADDRVTISTQGSTLWQWMSGDIKSSDLQNVYTSIDGLLDPKDLQTLQELSTALADENGTPADMEGLKSQLVMDRYLGPNAGSNEPLLNEDYVRSLMEQSAANDNSNQSYNALLENTLSYFQNQA